IIPRKTAAHFCWKCSVSTHYPAQNRFALLLEMLCLYALSYAKPLRTFAGNALSLRIVPRKNRFALLLEMLCLYALSDAKPLRTFAGNAMSLRIIPRKNASHFGRVPSGGVARQ